MKNLSLVNHVQKFTLFLIRAFSSSFMLDTNLLLKFYCKNAFCTKINFGNFTSLCVIPADGVGSEVCSLPPDVGQSERGQLYTNRGAPMPSENTFL